MSPSTNMLTNLDNKHGRGSSSSLAKDVEQVDVYEYNKYAGMGLSHEEAEFYDTFPEDQRKALVRKVDLRLVPVLATLYLFSHIDRANIGNAKIEGMMEDLGMSGIQYNIALSIFFIPYILLEVPSNVLLKKFKRPSQYIGMLVVSWGTIMTLTGLVKNFAGLMVTRVMLGIAEAGFFPGAVYLITHWYAQRQVQTRLALFYCASALSGAFSGLLAFAISKMDGFGGRPGWAWIFLLEGIATVVVGVCCFFVMPDTPSLSGKWLNQNEQRYLVLQNVIKNAGRGTSDDGEKADKFKWVYLKDLLTDYKVYLQSWILFTASVCAYGLKFTMPSITKSMGYTSSQAQLMTVPPYVAGAISAIALSKLSDRFQWRAPFIFGQMAIVTLGFAMLLALAPNIKHQIPACYIGVVFVCIGQYPTNPAGSAWISSNLAGESKRAMGIALNIALGNCGGIVGSYIFLDNEKPGYPTGFGIGLAFAAFTLFSTVVLELSYMRLNKKRDALDEAQVRETYTEEDLQKMGDKSPLFKYKL
ncbi:MFS general substrate transporter, partial [Aureobasidium melanogenum]